MTRRPLQLVRPSETLHGKHEIRALAKSEPVTKLRGEADRLLVRVPDMVRAGGALDAVRAIAQAQFLLAKADLLERDERKRSELWWAKS